MLRTLTDYGCSTRCHSISLDPTRFILNLIRLVHESRRIMTRLLLARGSRLTRELWQVVPSTGTSESINSKIHACSCSRYLTRKRPACTGQINHNNCLFFFHHHRLPVRVGAHHGVLCPAGWLRGKEAGLLSRPATCPPQHTRTQPRHAFTSYTSKSSRLFHTHKQLEILVERNDEY